MHVIKLDLSLNHNYSKYIEFHIGTDCVLQSVHTESKIKIDCSENLMNISHEPDLKTQIFNFVNHDEMYNETEHKSFIHSHS